MIKYYCDLCETEISPDNSVKIYVHHEMNVSDGFGTPFVHKFEREKILCNKCGAPWIKLFETGKEK